MIKKKWSSVWILSFVFGCVFLLGQMRSNCQESEPSRGLIEFEVKGLLANKSAQPPIAASLEKTMLDAVIPASRKTEFNRPQVAGNRRITESAGEATQKIDLTKLVLDVSKSGIERRLESRIAQVAIAEDHAGAGIPSVLVNDNPVVPDESKRVIESGVMAELNTVTAAGINLQEQIANPNSQSRRGSAQATANPVESTATANNPQVEPGKIEWHEDFEAACLASELSSKPVLHFQLLGELDQRFT